MEYTFLGNTGMTVCRLCLSCMSFGSTEWEEWALEEDGALPVIERAIDLGITFFGITERSSANRRMAPGNTANVYSDGESERILGTSPEGRREESVVATKGFFQMAETDPNSGGLSRKAIEQELDNSLDRLGLDVVDLYQIHRWDPETPIEQTLRAVDDAVAALDSSLSESDIDYLEEPYESKRISGH